MFFEKIFSCNHWNAGILCDGWWRVEPSEYRPVPRLLSEQVEPDTMWKEMKRVGLEKVWLAIRTRQELIYLCQEAVRARC